MLSGWPVWNACRGCQSCLAIASLRVWHRLAGDREQARALAAELQARLAPRCAGSGRRLRAPQ